MTSAHQRHYDGVIVSTMASQITSLTIVYSTVYSGANQRKHQSSAFVRGIHRGPVNSPQKSRKCFYLMTSSWAQRLSSVTSTAFWNVSTENRKGLVPSNRPVAQNPQWNSPISHNSPLSNWHMHISVAKLCIVGYLSNALWDLWERIIRPKTDNIDPNVPHFVSIWHGYGVFTRQQEFPFYWNKSSLCDRQ